MLIIQAGLLRMYSNAGGRPETESITQSGHWFRRLGAITQAQPDRRPPDDCERRTRSASAGEFI
jgi:hypothetical protein